MHELDRQTDGQTDRILIARPCLHSKQRGKKGWNAIENKKDDDWPSVQSGLYALARPAWDR